jgi:hypothetical protein
MYIYGPRLRKVGLANMASFIGSPGKVREK